jgi:hypothetical protein
MACIMYRNISDCDKPGPCDRCICNITNDELDDDELAGDCDNCGSCVDRCLNDLGITEEQLVEGKGL